MPNKIGDLIPPDHICPICGHGWRHGESGDHQCAGRLLARIKTLEANLILLSGKRLVDVTLTRAQITGLLGELGTAERITFAVEGTPRNNLRL